jgi:hypothetical protein
VRGVRMARGRKAVGHDASYGERRDIAIVEIVIETAGQAIH